MIKFGNEQVLLLQKLLIEETGGAFGVRDLNLLDSALNNAFSSWDGVDLYPSKQEKGAILGFALVSNHAFVDGNKRIGMHVMLSFFEINGIKIKATNNEIVQIGLGVASGEIKYDGLLIWVKKHDVT